MSKGIIQDPNVHYCIDIILREARQENRLVKLLLYTMLSAYTKNPINLAINAPSGEGKTHVIMKVVEKFPEEDVIVLSGMTDKALFHRAGILVVQNDNGQYESVEQTLEDIDIKIEENENELAANKNADRKKLQYAISQLRKSKKELLKNAKKLIDLQHRILVFLDTPSLKLFEAIMPLLSHDKYEVEYEYVDTSNGIKTKGNVIRGWPAVIFAQAIDFSHYQRYPEIQRRFIIANPKMTSQKYREAINLTALKFAVPHFIYEEEVVSDKEKDKARAIVESVKDRISDIAARHPEGKYNVFNPFWKVIAKALPSQNAFDMTIASRFFSFLLLLPIINFDQRPRLVTRKEGSLELVVCPMPTFQDLQETIYLMENASGVRPYILEWFNEVFLPTYQRKREPDGEDDKQESYTAVTTEDLVKATLEKQQKSYSKKQILENLLNPLVNQGYIEKERSEINRRENIYYPVRAIKQAKLFEKPDSNNYLDFAKIPVTDITDFPNVDYITSSIQALMKYSPAYIIYRLEDANGNEKTAFEIASAYYSDAENYFRIEKSPVSDEHPEKPESSSVQPKLLEKYSISRQSNILEAEKFCCPYCKCIEENQDKYERHIIISHPGKPGYPS